MHPCVQPGVAGFTQLVGHASQRAVWSYRPNRAVLQQVVVDISDYWGNKDVTSRLLTGIYRQSIL